jgi:hypothetical protein
LLIFAAGLLSGAGLVALGHLLGPRTTPPPVLKLAPPQNTWDNPSVNATVPPIARTSSDFEPVYLTDEQIANRERGRNGVNARAAHDPLEAERRVNGPL